MFYGKTLQSRVWCMSESEVFELGVRLRQEYPTHVRKYFWGEHFWSGACFAGSCGGAPLTVDEKEPLIGSRWRSRSHGSKSLR